MHPRVTEFHCIMPLENIPSVMEHGILSHERVARLPHSSVAMSLIQERRDAKQVPGGLKLRQYANLYLHARNPMLYKLQGRFAELCVLRVAVEVCQLDGVVVADRNASSDYVRFLHPDQWRVLDFDAIYALDWRHPDDPAAFYRHKSQKCAEVLVPDRVEARFLTGACVAENATVDRLRSLGFALPVEVTPVLFFAR